MIVVSDTSPIRALVFLDQLFNRLTEDLGFFIDEPLRRWALVQAGESR